jgi:hypothetical protein
VKRLSRQAKTDQADSYHGFLCTTFTAFQSKRTIQASIPERILAKQKTPGFCRSASSFAAAYVLVLGQSFTEFWG